MLQLRKKVVIENRKLELAIIRCPVCKKNVLHAETRLAELPAIKQEAEMDFSYCRSYQAIGISYMHYDRTFCDVSLF